MESIIVKDAFENNLKHININIPLNAFSCVTGDSGSGKSSLVFDTIFAESQRAFLEGMSGVQYGQKLMKKPKVGLVDNLRPSMNISQNYYNLNPRSTIGTVTDISYYLRSLFSLVNSEEYSIDESFFSANNPDSCCPHCMGLGLESFVSEDLLIPNRELALNEGAILYYSGTSAGKEQKELEAICNYYNIDICKKVSELTTQEYNCLMFSDELIKVKIDYKEGKRRKQYSVFLKGVVKNIEDKIQGEKQLATYTGPYSKYLDMRECHLCHGMRLRTNVLQYTVCGLNYSQVETLEIKKLYEWFKSINISNLPANKADLVTQLLSTCIPKISSLLDLNLGYLSLSRSIPSLSGGERQRVRMSLQLNCSLKDLIYILDEPCKGLHYRDVKCIIDASRNLVNRGNTVIAIEHNEQYIKSCDNIIKLGPTGGPEGGYLIDPNSSHVRRAPTASFKQYCPTDNWLEFANINYRNLTDVSLQIPMGKITFVTGVSGSGKTSLIHIISECVKNNHNYHCDVFKEDCEIKKVYEVNQAPIGKTPRSTVISYLNLSNTLRNLFASVPEAKKKRISSAMFSMNVSGGRCECCQGTGLQKIDLNYLPSTYITCPICHGKRFKDDVLAIKYKNHSIQEVLDSPISDIVDVFKDNKTIKHMIDVLLSLGLKYITLGQMSMNLSGGEAQRLKIAKVLCESSASNSMFLLDEPTSGLSSNDISQIEKVILDLQSKGNTIIIIDHNIDTIIRLSDYLIDMGIYGGQNGGQIMFQGDPQQAFENRNCSLYGLHKVTVQ